MLQVENIAKAYAGDPVLEGISFVMNKGERIALVGMNGTGKSTLMRIITGEESSDAGAVRIPKDYSIGYLQQHLQFTENTVRDEAALGLRPDERDMVYKVEALLSGLGFSEEDMDRSPSEFSGGYHLRIHLAKCLAAEPECLLLDEPTNYLDVVTIRWLRDFLRKWRGELLVISHDRAFLDAVATHTMGIQRKKLLKIKGGSAEYYDQVLQREEIHERTRQNLDKKKAGAQKFVERFGAKATKAKQAQSKLKMIEKLPSLEKLASIHSLDFTFRAAPHPGEQMIRAENVEFRYDGMDTPLIEDCSIEINKGDRIAVIGKNGRGKSTLLRILGGELTPQDGKLKISDNLSVGYFGQTNILRLNSDLTILEEISRTNPQLAHPQVRKICGTMMFPGTKAEKRIGVLSGGEKSRVLLGKILASPCNLLLLDEPTNHLDMESVEALMEALEDFEGAVVLVTHVEELLARLPERLLVCRNGHQEMFWGDYGLFLEQNGWDDPEMRGTKKKKNLSKRERAELVQARSAAVKPLETKASKIEKDIEKTEKALEKAHEAMLDPSADMASLAKSTGEHQKKRDQLYVDLEKCYSQIELKRTEFDIS